MQLLAFAIAIPRALGINSMLASSNARRTVPAGRALARQFKAVVFSSMHQAVPPHATDLYSKPSAPSAATSRQRYWFQACTPTAALPLRSARANSRVCLALGCAKPQSSASSVASASQSLGYPAVAQKLRPNMSVNRSANGWPPCPRGAACLSCASRARRPSVVARLPLR